MDGKIQKQNDRTNTYEKFKLLIAKNIKFEDSYHITG